ncbi:YjgN family protein [Methylomonas sp. YC3]
MTEYQSRQLQFSGSGGEYFRIWIVNVCLSIVTLGVYSAWAKVKRNQYFYRHTTLAGAGFDYHGDPKAILKGRIVAFLLFAGYTLVGEFDQLAGLAILLVIVSVMPWLLMRSLRFRMHNTSYRGLRFAFHGNTGAAYFNFLLLPVLSALTLGLLWPLAQQRMARYTRENSTYGNEFFKFFAGIGAYYRIYLMTIFIGVLVFAGLMVSVMLLGSKELIPVEAEQLVAMSVLVAAIGTYLALFLLAYPYVAARLQNLVWNSTQLGPHGFQAQLQAREMLGIMFSNVLLTLLTLGLYKPFADIRLARYRIERVALLPRGNIDEFVAGLQTNTSAAGEELAEMFDFDIAL